ncbi:hypothetical protein CF641_37320, partial [Burkholderia pseudomallei]
MRGAGRTGTAAVQGAQPAGRTGHTPRPLPAQGAAFDQLPAAPQEPAVHAGPTGAAVADPDSGPADAAATQCTR